MQTRFYCLPHKHNHRHKSKETTEWSHGNILSERSPALIFRQSRMSRVEGGEMSVGTTICGRNLYFSKGFHPRRRGVFGITRVLALAKNTRIAAFVLAFLLSGTEGKKEGLLSLFLFFFRLRSRSRISFPDEFQENKNLLV